MGRLLCQDEGGVICVTRKVNTGRERRRVRWDTSVGHIAAATWPVVPSVFDWLVPDLAPSLAKPMRPLQAATPTRCHEYQR